MDAFTRRPWDKQDQHLSDRERLFRAVAAATPKPTDILHPGSHEVRFIHADYTNPLDLGVESFDLVISHHAGLVSPHCTRDLRKGRCLLAHPSHGDAASELRNTGAHVHTDG